MEATKLLQILHQAERLKDTLRHSWTSHGRQESVAEHSWRMALFAYLLKDDFDGIDWNQVILMCLFHDFAESFTGDVPVFQKTQADEAHEEQALQGWLVSLSEPFQTELRALFQQMKEQKTPEARIMKAIDKLEVVDQHNLADLSTWIKLEWTLNLEHGASQTAEFAKLEELRRLMNEQTRNKLAQQEKDD